jgi:hypothetical protein
MPCSGWVDVDRAGAAIDWSDRNAPAPTLTITNPENGTRTCYTRWKPRYVLRRTAK